MKPAQSEWTILLKVGTEENPRWMHIYFDVLIYYIGLFVTFLFGFVLKMCEDRNISGLGQIAKLLRKEIVVFPFGYPSSRVGITILQVFVGALWTGITVSIFVMFYWHHDFRFVIFNNLFFFVFCFGLDWFWF